MTERKLCVCERCHRWFSVNAAFTPKQCSECNGAVQIVDIDYYEYSSWDEVTKQEFRALYEKSLPKVKARTLHTPGHYCRLFGMILSVLYAIYIVSYFGGIALDDAGSFIASILVAPHMICVVVGSVFSLVGFFGEKRWAVLTSAILMAVAAALFPKYAGFVLVQAILLFVGYAKMLNNKKPA